MLIKNSKQKSLASLQFNVMLISKTMAVKQSKMACKLHRHNTVLGNLRLLTITVTPEGTDTDTEYIIGVGNMAKH